MCGRNISRSWPFGTVQKQSASRKVHLHLQMWIPIDRLLYMEQDARTDESFWEDPFSSETNNCHKPAAIDLRAALYALLCTPDSRTTFFLCLITATVRTLSWAHQPLLTQSCASWTSAFAPRPKVTARYEQKTKQTYKSTELNVNTWTSDKAAWRKQRILLELTSWPLTQYVCWISAFTGDWYL